jgi:hypothetical protein
MIAKVVCLLSLRYGNPIAINMIQIKIGAHPERCTCRQILLVSVVGSG